MNVEEFILEVTSGGVNPAQIRVSSVVGLCCSDPLGLENLKEQSLHNFSG